MVEGESLVSIGSYEFLRYEGTSGLRTRTRSTTPTWIRDLAPIAGEPPFENHRGYVVLFHVEKRLHTSGGGSPTQYCTRAAGRTRRRSPHGQGPGWEAKKWTLTAGTERNTTEHQGTERQELVRAVRLKANKTGTRVPVLRAPA